jgi:DNA repair protein RadC
MAVHIKLTNRTNSEDPPPYLLPKQAEEDVIIAAALEILDKRVKKECLLASPQAVRQWLAVRAAGLECEVFTVVLLDASHSLIKADDMFRGTLTQTSVYPREVVKLALKENAAAVILLHNHPSGNPQPSRADEYLTQTMKAALALVDVRVLDHIITAGGETCSMAEKGLM